MKFYSCFEHFLAVRAIEFLCSVHSHMLQKFAPCNERFCAQKALEAFLCNVHSHMLFKPFTCIERVCTQKTAEGFLHSVRSHVLQKAVKRFLPSVHSHMLLKITGAREGLGTKRTTFLNPEIKACLVLKLLTTFNRKSMGYSIRRFNIKMTSSFPFMRLCLLVEFLTE